MKTSAKLMSLVLAFCLLLSVGAFASGEASGSAEAGGAFAQVDDTHWAGGSVTIEGVEYAPEFTDQGYVDSTLFTSVDKILTDAGEIDVDNTVYTPILTVDGVQVDLYNITEETAFEGDVVLTLVEKGASNANQGAPFGADKAQSSFGPFYYTAAAYIADGAYDAAKSAGAAQITGEVTDTEASGLQVVSAGDYFSGLYIADTDYAIRGASMYFTGAGGDDFNGWGAGVVVLGSSNVEISDSMIVSQGVLRSGLFTSGSAVTTVKDSVIVSRNDEDAIPYDTEDNYATPMMQQCPFGLGIQGNIRASLACGAGRNIFENSLVVSNGWAVLSTDSGQSGADALIANAMVAVVGEIAEDEADADFVYEVNGEKLPVSVGRYGETSGYIAYADSGVNDYAYGSAWYSPDYLGIITTGAITMADGGYGWSGRIGFMSHSGGGSSGHGTLNVSDSSFDIQDAFAVTQLSGTYSTSTTLDNVDISLAGNGADILYIQLNSDDNAGGPGNTSNTLTDLTYDEYLTVEAASGEPSENFSDLNVSNSVVQGNVYNGATDDGVGLVVNLDNAEIDGEISSAWTYHVDADGNALDTTVIDCDYYTGTRDGANGVYDYTMYLRVNAEAAPTVNNPVTVNMENGSKWMVTGTNYISALTIDESSSILGMGLTMTVDGVETAIEPGSYTGEIVLSAGEAPEREAGDAEIKAPVIGEAASVELAAAEAEPAFEADVTFEPFNVAIDGDMVLPFSSVKLAVTDSTAAIFIPDTSKLIECEIIDGEWVMEGSDFVDDAIIAAAKALYGGADAAPAASGEAASGGDWDAWIAYLKELAVDGSIADIQEQVLRELDEAQESDYEGMLDGTVFGVFAFTYDAIPFEDFQG